MTRLHGRLGGRLGDRGATAVELALVMPLVLALLGSLVLFGLRATYAAAAQHSARTALSLAVLPSSVGDRGLDPVEICTRARDAVPTLLRPGGVDCNPTGGTADFAVQVCPPACTGDIVAACTPVAAPRLRAQGTSRSRVVALGSSPTPTPTPSPSSTRNPLLDAFRPTSTPTPPPTPTPTLAAPVPTVGATAQSTTGTGIGGLPVPGVTLPPVLPTALPTLPTSIVLTPVPGVSASAGASVAPLFPTATAGPPGDCDEQEGRTVAVQVRWEVGALAPLLSFFGGSEGLTRVSATASGRRE